MCGILGWIGTGATREAFEARLDQLRHRGPDGSGLWQDRPRDVLLGHRRLSIIDLSPTGAQPMVDASGRWVIVFNGEIYNFVELRAELEAAGASFRGRSDTEVLLEAYKRWGESCLARLNGMFAFAIYDSGSSATPPSVFLARDRVGKKPLYYLHDRTSLRFASELKALGHDGRLDLAALNHYLTYGCYPDELCFQQDVRKLPAGQAARFTLSTGQWRQWVWWTLPDRPAGAREVGAFARCDRSQNGRAADPGSDGRPGERSAPVLSGPAVRLLPAAERRFGGLPRQVNACADANAEGVENAYHEPSERSARGLGVPAQKRSRVSTIRRAAWPSQPSGTRPVLP
jgi:asparagine synthase (glutamine-hydrolysing)